MKTTFRSMEKAFGFICETKEEEEEKAVAKK
jgi:hypothetical protein